MEVEDYCNALRTWAKLMEETKKKKWKEDDHEIYRKDYEQFREAKDVLELAIDKSCLLNRIIYCGEQPSQTPCPVHKGHWSGINIGWPGEMWSDGTPVEESELLRKEYDNGCRCYQHKCGCTTGWQPDEHCGCKGDK